MKNREYITPDKLFNNSIELGLKIYKSGYKPKYIMGIWRGGAQTSIIIQELLEYLPNSINIKHILLGTSSYNNIEKQNCNIQLYGQLDIIKKLKKEDVILIIDDVHDTGLSIQKVKKYIKMNCQSMPIIKVATLYFKSKNNKTKSIPDFYIYNTDDWLIFPHELIGLQLNEIIENKKIDIFLKKEFKYLARF